MGNRTAAIIDTGASNIFNLQRALEVVGFSSLIVRDAEDAVGLHKVLLPGVGSYSAVMARLVDRGFDLCLREIVDQGVHLLGICLGMQLLVSEGHENGLTTGLGLISGRAVPMPTTDTKGAPLRIPHIGWAEVSAGKDDLLKDASFDTREMYFAHSFHVVTDEPSAVAGTFQYGGRTFNAAIRNGNVMGVQFHPERSGDCGLDFLDNFMRQ